MLPKCSATQFSQLALRPAIILLPGVTDVSFRTRDRTRSSGQFVRAQKAEQKAEHIQHALNLVLNLGFERFHTAQTMDGAVHEFELGTIRNLPASDPLDSPIPGDIAKGRHVFSSSRARHTERRGLPATLMASVAHKVTI